MKIVQNNIVSNVDTTTISGGMAFQGLVCTFNCNKTGKIIDLHLSATEALTLTRDLVETLRAMSQPNQG